MSACTGKRNAVPLVRQVEFLPLADGAPYPRALGEWLYEFPPEGVDVRFEPQFSPRLPPFDTLVLEADDRARLEAALHDPAPTGESPPTPPSGMRIVFEEIETQLQPGAAPVTRWRAHVVDTQRGFVTSGATASVKFPSRKDEYGGLQLFLSDQDAERFHTLTTEFDGRRIAIALGDRALSVPVVNEPIPGGEVMITPGGSDPGERAAEMQALFAELTGT